MSKVAKLKVLYQGPIAKYKTIAHIETLDQAIEELKKSEYRTGVFISEEGKETKIILDKSNITVSFQN